METFEQLVKNAADTTHQLRVVEANRPKLTGRAFVNAAVKNANTTPKRLRKLEQMLGQQTMEPLRGFIHRATIAIRDNFCYPPDKLNRIRYLGNDDVAATMATVQSNYFEMFALAAVIAENKYPDNFGTITDWAAHEAYIKHLRATCAALYLEIATECRGSDLSVKDAGRGMAYVTFAMTDGEVSLYPTRDAGSRLVDWVLNHPGMVEAA